MFRDHLSPYTEAINDCSLVNKSKTVQGHHGVPRSSLKVLSWPSRMVTELTYWLPGSWASHWHAWFNQTAGKQHLWRPCHPLHRQPTPLRLSGRQILRPRRIPRRMHATGKKWHTGGSYLENSAQHITTVLGVVRLTRLPTEWRSSRQCKTPGST